MQIKNRISLTGKNLFRFMMFAVILVAFGMLGASGAHAQELPSIGSLNGMAVSISVDNSSFRSGDDVVVHVNIKNPTDSQARILKWLTPTAGVEQSLFKVSLDGKDVAYLGKLVKRAAPTESDYITLQPGESLSGDVNLSDYYDLSSSGNYDVNYSVVSAELYSNGDKQQLKSTDFLASNALNLFVEGRASQVLPEMSPLVVTGTTGFVSCSASQQTDLINARNEASTYAANAVAYFNANKQGARYTTWFGVYDSGRYSSVAGHFANVQNAIDNANPMTFDCSLDACQSGWFAYVYPDQPYTIHLCDAFWTAPTTGTDSQAGTLIHEVTHFTIVADTDDYAYGQSAAKALAISNPAQAVMNADNHEYFAENNPPLETGTGSCSGDSNSPLFTTQDNQDNAGSGVGDCDMDTYLFNTSSIQPIEFTINVPSGTSVASAGLLLKQWDVDETDGEVDEVYFNGNYAGSLTGANGIWSTTFLTLDPSWVKAGDNLVKINIDVLNVDVWAVQTDWGQLLLNGETGGTANITATTLDQVEYQSGAPLQVDIAVDTILSSQNVQIEVNLRDPKGVILDGVVIDQSLVSKEVAGNASAPVTVNFNMPYEGPTGTYDIQVLVYDTASNFIQDYTIVPFHLTGTYTFYDVPSSYWAWPYIESLYNASITGGCGSSPLTYCPEDTVTRAQMAIFILRGIHGSAYTPPPATGTVFADVPLGSFAADWIEQLALEGVTAGCGNGNYCPDATITRAQMAIFLLRGEHGSAYIPPAATGTIFSDVPLGSFAVDWIEQLAAEGITSGCGGGNYCPNSNVTRAEMAVFLVRAFSLP
ncbi:M35 family metallo-endopeptidase [Candidatus Villigracilis affinis]|uniref:M35 family metallo-endopeptidase n=1 Tax=Candidatus Villigracilis affinis TaxID=3140682 RepID=UPI001D6ABBAA|nr:S-layer homology domain-containing protein [Anaerolineales bacterium]